MLVSRHRDYDSSDSREACPETDHQANGRADETRQRYCRPSCRKRRQLRTDPKGTNRHPQRSQNHRLLRPPLPHVRTKLCPLLQQHLQVLPVHDQQRQPVRSRPQGRSRQGSHHHPKQTNPLAQPQPSSPRRLQDTRQNIAQGCPTQGSQLL